MWNDWNLRIRVEEEAPNGGRDMGLCARLEWLVRANTTPRREAHHCTLYAEMRRRLALLRAGMPCSVMLAISQGVEAILNATLLKVRNLLSVPLWGRTVWLVIAEYHPLNNVFPKQHGRIRIFDASTGILTNRRFA
jgi:hypothetical protein